MRNLNRLLLVIVFLATCVWAGDANACVGPAQAAVASAISAAADGSTIDVCAGSASWSSPPALPNTKGLKIACRSRCSP